MEKKDKEKRKKRNNLGFRILCFLCCNGTTFYSSLCICPKRTRRAIPEARSGRCERPRARARATCWGVYTSLECTVFGYIWVYLGIFGVYLGYILAIFGVYFGYYVIIYQNSFRRSVNLKPRREGWPGAVAWHLKVHLTVGGWSGEWSIGSPELGGE